MINRVLVAGRIVEGPHLQTKPDGRKAAVLKLEVRHPLWGVRGTEACTIEVHCEGDRRADVIERYLQVGRDFMVEGHLKDLDGTLCVIVDQFHFMESRLTTEYFHTEGAADALAA